MTARTKFVPLHSIVVVRDGKQVDAYEEYKQTGKAFTFTADEIDEITKTHDGNVELSLRDPANEASDDEETKMSPGTDDANAGDKKVAKPKMATDAKDSDL